MILVDDARAACSAARAATGGKILIGQRTGVSTDFYKAVAYCNQLQAGKDRVDNLF